MNLSDYDSLAFFQASEFGDHAEHMQFHFLRRLDQARKLALVPFKITSAYRVIPKDFDPEKDSDSSHYYGVAVDIACTGSRERFYIVNAAIRAGITRIGVYDRHVHLDSGDKLDADKFPPKVMWEGKSR